MPNPSNRERHAAKGALAGAIGGAAGTLAMNYGQRLWTRAVDEDVPESAAGKHDARDWQERHEQQNSNELAAQRVSIAVTGRPLTRDELPLAAALVHFAFGAAVGALYGACLEWTGARRRVSGLGLGTTVWVAADEIAMPALRLSRPTTERPAALHLQSLAAHVVYGVVTEFVRRQVRVRLSDR